MDPRRLARRRGTRRGDLVHRRAGHHDLGRQPRAHRGHHRAAGGRHAAVRRLLAARQVLRAGVDALHSRAGRPGAAQAHAVGDGRRLFPCRVPRDVRDRALLPGAVGAGRRRRQDRGARRDGRRRGRPRRDRPGDLQVQPAPADRPVLRRHLGAAGAPRGCLHRPRHRSAAGSRRARCHPPRLRPGAAARASIRRAKRSAGSWRFFWRSRSASGRRAARPPRRAPPEPFAD